MNKTEISEGLISANDSIQKLLDEARIIISSIDSAEDIKKYDDELKWYKSQFRKSIKSCRQFIISVPARRP